MTIIQRPNTRIVALALVAVAVIGGSWGMVQRAAQPETAVAGAVYTYASEAKWYNGPVAKPVLSNDFMAFISLWENAGQSKYLYVTDLATGKDAKITINSSLSSIAEPAISNNYVAWNDTQKNKWTISLFERYSYQTFIVQDTMNEVTRPSVDGTRVVWAEANSDQGGAQIKFYDHSAPNVQTLAAGKVMSAPVIAGNYVAWFESSAQCSSQAYRLCMNGGPWNLVAYNLTTQGVTTVAKNINVKVTNGSLAISPTQLVWSAKTLHANGTGQYDLWRYSFTAGNAEQITSNALIETQLAMSEGRVAYIGSAVSGSPAVVHILNLATLEDIAMPFKKSNQSHVTISGTRVAWDEVRTDSRIYIYDFNLNAAKQDTDSDSIPAEAEKKLGTDDLMKDTDGDGLSDTDEVVLFMTNPTTVDSDGDGISDYRELYLYKTNPTMFDTDGDGYHDGLEIKNNYSPTNPQPVKVNKNRYEWTAPAKP